MGLLKLLFFYLIKESLFKHKVEQLFFTTNINISNGNFVLLNI